MYFLAKDYYHIMNRFSKKLYLNMDFKNHPEFERKHLQISLQRIRIYNLVVCVLSFYNVYLDFMLYQDPSVDVIYRRNLFWIHIIIFLLSIAYLISFKLLEKQNRQYSFTAKALLLSELSLMVFLASVLSINSQRFTGNIDAYIMVSLVAALVICIYPKWVIVIYGINHILFLIGISYFCRDGSAIIKQCNSTTTVLAAVLLFLFLYRSNVISFLHEEMLEEDKQTFIKLFEINPFPLLISRFEDGEIQYLNHKAMVFYDIPGATSDTLNHKQLYKNPRDFNSIRKALESDGKIADYLVEQKTLSGQIKYAVVNFELIDYFGEKSILSGVADIGEIKRIERELTVYASTDPLTGVLNRRAGMDMIKRKFEAARHSKEEFNLFFYDVDNLKIVNDTFGHLEGDALIKDVCRIIREELSPDDIIFRYGGDEFMIIFENSSEQEVRKVYTRISQRFQALNQNKQKPYEIDASLGVFSYKPEMNLNLDQIIEIVDKDMYHNKAMKKLCL